MPEALSTGGTIAIIAVAMVFMWLVCFWLVAEIGGWSSLAKTFATDRPPTGDTFPWSSGKCNFFSSYNNCLTISVSKEGVGLQPMLLFRFRHKPLFLPWDAIAVMRPNPQLFRYGTSFEITTPGGVHPITLFGRPLAETLTKYAPDRLLGPSGGP